MPTVGLDSLGNFLFSLFSLLRATVRSTNRVSRSIDVTYDKKTKAYTMQTVQSRGEAHHKA